MSTRRATFGDLVRASWSDWSPFFSLLIRGCAGLVAWVLADQFLRRTIDLVVGAAPSSYLLVACVKISYAVLFATVVESLSLLLKFTRWRRVEIVEGWLTAFFIGILVNPVRWPDSTSLGNTPEFLTMAFAIVAAFLMNRVRVRRLIREGDANDA